MTYVIGRKCVDVMHRDCVQECPVDCIYEGDRSLYINANECVDCGACKLICEVGAIYYETDLPDDEVLHLIDNAAFFARTLPGRDAPLGNPGGATELGRIGVDTPYVASLPRKEPTEQAMSEPVAPIVELSEDKSWQLLSSMALGRLVTSVGRYPEIFPVNYVAQHRTVLFRTAEGTKLISAVMNSRSRLRA